MTVTDTRPAAAPTRTTATARRSSTFPSAVRHGLTLAWRNVVRIRHSPEELLDVTLQPIVFILLFTFVFGGAISTSWHDYLPYVLPGILAQTVVFASIATGTTLNTDLTKGVFDRFRSLPISRSAPLVGYVLGDIVRYLVVIVVILAFGSALGFRIHTDPGSALLACVLALGFGLAMCWVSVFIGLLARSPGTVQGLSFVFMFPLTFGSNVFAKTTTMPGWLQAWVKINPISQLVDAVRGLLIGGPVAGPVWKAVVAALAIMAVFMPLALAAYRRRT